MRVSLRHQTTILTTLSTFFHFAESILVNATIDDTIPDPFSGATVSYSPAEAWNDGPSCQNCTAHPDPAQMISGTWHDATFNSQPGSNDFPNSPLFATTTFSGSAVYVICALAQSTNFPAGNSNMSFFIDNDLVGTFELPAPGGTGYTYRVPVYANSSLEPGQHQITIQNGQPNGPKSLILLDAVIYSFDEDLPVPQSQVPPSPSPQPQQFSPQSQNAPSPPQDSPPPSITSPLQPSSTSSSQQPVQSVSVSSSRPFPPSQQFTSSTQGSLSFPQQSNESHPTQSPSQLSVKSILSRVGVIVGLVLGGLCLLGVIAAFIYYWRRRQRRLAHAANTLDTRVARPTRPMFIPTPFDIPPTSPLQDGVENTPEGKRAGLAANNSTPLLTRWQENNQLGSTSIAGTSTRPAMQHHHNHQASFGFSISATTSESSQSLIPASDHRPLTSQNHLLDGGNSDLSTMPLLRSTPPPAYASEVRDTLLDLDSVINISPQAVRHDL